MMIENQNIEDTTQETPVKKSWGGSRPGAGRKPGSPNTITVQYLMERLEAKGAHYADTLVDDFNAARERKDHVLVLKYHNLILNKLMPIVANVTVEHTGDTVQDRAEAFITAINSLVARNDSNSATTPLIQGTIVDIPVQDK